MKRKPVILDLYGGEHFYTAIQKAVAMTKEHTRDVVFDFNGTTYTVKRGDSFETAKAKIEAITGHPILSPEEVATKASEDLERMRREQAESIAAAAVMTEQQMREATVPWPKTPEELTAYIATLVQRPHDYGTCVYAMSMAAVAAFQYVAHELGTTGFQASCADMDILRRTRGLEGPFMLVKGEDALYPQYDLSGKVQEFLTDIQPWMKEKATALLADRGNGRAHPNVVAHWQALAK